MREQLTHAQPFARIDDVPVEGEQFVYRQYVGGRSRHPVDYHGAPQQLPLLELLVGLRHLAEGEALGVIAHQALLGKVNDRLQVRDAAAGKAEHLAIARQQVEPGMRAACPCLRR